MLQLEIGCPQFRNKAIAVLVTPSVVLGELSHSSGVLPLLYGRFFLKWVFYTKGSITTGGSLVEEDSAHGVITIAEPPLVFAITLPPPPTPLITHMQQTPFPIPKIAPSKSLQDLPNFGSLFGFSILGIVDAYLANKMNEAVKTAVQLQSDRLRDEAQAKNKDFLNKLDENIKKIIKDQVKEQVKAQVSKILPRIEKTVNEQLKAEVMTRSTTESKTSLAIAANLSELELKNILIEKMESNKSIHISN
ncbi:hypothetical protein Tco_1008881 [Tanacetum coccineum]